MQKRAKISTNNSNAHSRSQWDYVLTPKQPIGMREILCSRKEKKIKCNDSCAGSVYLEEAVDGIYHSDLTSAKTNPDPLENGEYEAEWMSVCTDNHNTFRTHWKGYSYHTLEPRCHLRNAPILVNAAIDKYNSAHTQNKYKRKRNALPNIPELLQQKPQQCEICSKREASHKDWNLFGLLLVSPREVFQCSS